MELHSSTVTLFEADVNKSKGVLTLTHSLLFHEMLQSKGACSNSPIYSRLIFKAFT